MSRLLRVPLVIHEANAVVGLTNKWLAKIANHVLVGFPDVLQENRRQTYVGNPVRERIAAIEPPQNRLQGRAGQVNLLVVGGSLGAQSLNETVPLAIHLLQAELRPVIRHQAGRGKLSSTEEAYSALSIHAQCSEFIDDMAGAYQWADIVICRAGAMTVAEIAAAGVAAVFVPYPYAIYDHQTLNARFLTDSGAALMIDQASLTDASLAAILGELCSNRKRILELSVRARGCAIPDATTRVADICEEVMHA